MKRRDELRPLINAAIMLLAMLLMVTGAVFLGYDAGAVEADNQSGRIHGDDIPATRYASLEAMEADGIEADENALIESALVARANRIENCTVTHYDRCVSCCGKTDGITASGRVGTPYVTVAVDPSVIPLGADVLVDYGDGELHYYKADDTGSAINGNHIDLMVSDHDEAVQLGTRTATVYWVEVE